MQIVTAIVTRSTDSDKYWGSRRSYSAADDHADERHWQGNQHPGVANLRFSLVPDAYMQLTSGTVVQVCAAIPVTKTSGFPGTFADPAIDRVLLHQAVRLPLRPWSRWVAGLTQVSIGRFSQEEVSIVDKNALTLLDEGLFAGGRWPVVRVLSTDHEIERGYWKRARLYPACIRQHVDTLKQAVRRWIDETSSHV
jgi:hypothetical protein